MIWTEFVSFFPKVAWRYAFPNLVGSCSMFSGIMRCSSAASSGPGWTYVCGPETWSSSHASHVSSPGQACWIQVRQETETRETRERGAEKRGPWTGRHFHIQDGLESRDVCFSAHAQNTTEDNYPSLFFLAPMPPCRQNTWFLCVSTNHHRQSEVLGWFASLSVGSLSSCFPTVETLWFFLT